MRSSISKRGQTAVPAALRKKYNLGPNTKLEWIDYRGLIVALPVEGDPIKAIRGLTKGEGLHGRLMEARRLVRGRDRRIKARTNRRRAS